jgi:hypothetical protein
MPLIEWSEMSVVDKTNIAASPMVQGPCEVPHRIVLRDQGDQFVVHMQCFDGVQKSYFHQGDYYRKCGGLELTLAWSRFEQRARRSMQLAAPDKKAQEIADIAETIIKTLMGDDEERLRDEFENDYQLDSDVETFENLTGKKIRPLKEETA